VNKFSLAFFCFSRFAAGAKIIPCAVLGILLLMPALSASAEKIYTLGVVPQFQAKKTHRIWQPIVDELHKRTDIQLEVLSKPSTPKFEAALLAGEFDFVYMNPYHMLLAHQKQGYEPLARDIGKSLQGILVVAADSDISNVQQLDMQRIAFPSPNALGATLLIRQELSDDFNINVIPHYVKTHDSVYLNVALKQTGAGGGVQKTLDKQSEKVRDKLKVLYRTSKVASHPIAVHPRVTKTVSSKLQDALFSLGDNDSGRKLLASIPVTNIGKTSMSEYTTLMEKRLNRFTTEVK